MRSGDPLGDAKNVEKGHLAPSNLTFLLINCDRQKRFSQNERRRADLQKVAWDFLIFALGLSYDLSKFSDDFTPFFRLWKTITKWTSVPSFIKIVQAIKKVKFNLPSAIELSKTVVFVYNFV